MKLIIFTACLLFQSIAAQAQNITVRSGEHGPFTRVVFHLPNASAWQLSRLSSGYFLQFEPTLTPQKFDTTQAFKVISNQRLSALRPIASPPGLALDLVCACHIIPFEHSDKVLVLDIRDGPPPGGSIFERSQSGGDMMPPLNSPTPPQGSNLVNDSNSAPVANYSWLDTELPEQAIVKGGTPSLVPTPADASLDASLSQLPFAQALSTSLSEAASTGIVELDKAFGQFQADPKASQDVTTAAALPRQHSSSQGMRVTNPFDRPKALMADGYECTPSATLEIYRWSDDLDLARRDIAKLQLVNELYAPDPDAITKSIKLSLFMGFGAEARQMIDVFSLDIAEEPYLHAVSYLVDGEIPKKNSFQNMQSCDNIAALWALLAAPEDQVPQDVNGQAIAREFSLFPTHLRLHLGEGLFRRLILADDHNSAEIVKAAFNRIGSDHVQESARLDAYSLLHLDKPAEAESALAPDDQSIEALITLANARFAQLLPLKTKDLSALEALAFEHGTRTSNPQLHRALVRAKALNGEVGAAFTIANSAKNDAGLLQDIWLILAKATTDSTLLDHAVSASEATINALPTPTRIQIAQRLTNLGLPNAALPWLAKISNHPEITASTLIANNDARTALRILGTGSAPADPSLLAAAYQRLGATEEAVAALDAAGNHSEAVRLRRWLGQWSPTTAPTLDGQTSQTAPPNPAPEDEWQGLADLLPLRESAQTAQQSAENVALSLKASQELLNQSEKTLAAVSNLLGAVANPSDAASP